MTGLKRIDVIQPVPDRSAELGPAPHYRVGNDGTRDNVNNGPSCPCEACHQIRLASWDEPS